MIQLLQCHATALRQPKLVGREFAEAAATACARRPAGPQQWHLREPAAHESLLREDERDEEVT